MFLDLLHRKIMSYETDTLDAGSGNISLPNMAEAKNGDSRVGTGRAGTMENNFPSEKKNFRS